MSRMKKETARKKSMGDLWGGSPPSRNPGGVFVGGETLIGRRRSASLKLLTDGLGISPKNKKTHCMQRNTSGQLLIKTSGGTVWLEEVTTITS